MPPFAKTSVFDAPVEMNPVSKAAPFALCTAWSLFVQVMLSPALIVTGVGLYAKFTMFTLLVAAPGDASAMLAPNMRSPSAAIESRVARAASRIRYE